METTPRYLTNFNLSELPNFESDVLVLGGGIAGLTAALQASKRFTVTVLTKGKLQNTSTWYAQGGIAAALGAEDSPELHYNDTLAVGGSRCNPEAVRALVDEARPAIEMLLELGTRFDQADDVMLLGQEGGHTVRRVLHSRDATGSEVALSLGRAVRESANIRLIEDCFVVDLLADADGCFGALAYDTKAARYVAYRASAVVLSTGGIGQLYGGSTNPPIATGDGQAMAFRAGALLSDMEFVQFHPTALATDDNPRFLISEAVRGEGAHLVDADGRRFMVAEHPQAELAPRDVVSRAIVNVMEATGRDHVFLDARHLPADFVRHRFPHIWDKCQGYGFDLGRDLVPVAPAAHYLIGGVATDLEGRTSLPGLYASGEVACTGVHGANRLASNSLLEGLVFSRRICRHLDEHLEPCATAGRTVAPPAIGRRGEVGDLAAVRARLQQLMARNIGVVRTERGLIEARDELDSQDWLLSVAYDRPPAWEVQNMLILARLVVEAALTRRESVGVHWRARA